MLQKVALILGIVLTLLGLVGVGAYLVGVVDIMIDQPADRSWLFWGLGIAGPGATLLIGGIGLLTLWRHLRKTESGPEDR